MIKKIILLYIIILISAGALIFPRIILARKTRLRSSGSGGTFSSVSFFPNRLGIVINLFNLNKVDKVSYVLSYVGSGQTQGVVGSFAPTANSDSRELLFGTCSHGVCKYHENLSNAHLTLNFTLKAGSVVTKRYRLKV